MPATITIDSSYAQEIVEFWVHKYQQVKEELERLKSSASEREIESQEQTKALQDLIQKLQNENGQRKSTDDDLRKLLAELRSQRNHTTSLKVLEEASTAEAKEKLLRITSANEDLAQQLAAIGVEKLALTQQIQLFYNQAVWLAAEADKHRRTQVTNAFEPTHFVEDGFQPKLLLFMYPQTIITALTTSITEKHRLYFLPRPPTCMPLRVPACGKHGYWFYPAWLLPEDAEFELIVEGRPTEWSYLGRYVSSLLVGGEMKLSEWMALDDQTKMSHCIRVAQQNNPQPTGTQLPQPVAAQPLEIKRRYESGEWSVPCFTLRCVGFNHELYEALQTAADATVGISRSSIKRKSETPDLASKKSRKVSSSKSDSL